MDDKYKLLRAVLGDERVKKNELLKYHTFSKIGGPAKYFFIATNERELLQALNCALDLNIPYFILGAGTKMIISPKGLEGITIKNRISKIKIGGIKGKVGKNGLGIEEALVEVESGVSLSKLNSFLKEQSLKEILHLSSEHATVGGAIFIDKNLRELTHKIKIWYQGEIFETDSEFIRVGQHVIISVIFRVQAP